MQTTYYTLTAREIVLSGDGVQQAAGGARQLVCLRQNGGGQPRQKRNNVIDLAAWRAEREDVSADEALWEPAEEAVEAPPRRPRRSHAALMGGEWLATLSVVAAMAVLIVKIITF